MAASCSPAHTMRRSGCGRSRASSACGQSPTKVGLALGPWLSPCRASKAPPSRVYHCPWYAVRAATCPPRFPELLQCPFSSSSKCLNPCACPSCSPFPLSLPEGGIAAIICRALCSHDKRSQHWLLLGNASSPHASATWSSPSCLPPGVIAVLMATLIVPVTCWRTEVSKALSTSC